MNKHHPEQHLLADYAAGNLSIAQATCISVHLEHCAHCREQVRMLNHMGGELLEQMTSEACDEDLLNTVLGKLDDLPLETKEPRTEAFSGPDWLPKVLQRYEKARDSENQWRWLTPAVKRVTLADNKATDQLQLYRIKPGGKVGSHKHKGDEWTVVLKGSFSDSSGVYQAGDFLACSKGHMHRPIATADGECICLAAESAPINFMGWRGKILNPILNMGS